jgi:hypothetical protein
MATFHSKYRACVFLTARVQRRWAAGKELRQSGAWRAIFIFLPAKVIGIPYRGEHCQAAKRAAADNEGNSKAAEHGQPGRLNCPKIIRIVHKLLLRNRATAVADMMAGVR